MASLTYRTDAAITYTPGDEIDVAVRLAGRRLQVFWKGRDYSPAGCADAAGYALLTDALFGNQEQRTQFDANQVGLSLCTDVFVDKDAFSHAVYEDVETALTEAVSHYGVAASYSTLFSGTATVSNAGATNAIAMGGGYDISEFHVGQHIRVAMNFSAHGDQYGVIASISTPYVYTVDNLTTGANQGSDTGTARVYLADADTYGYAGSGARERTIDGSTVVDNPQAIKTSLALYGAGIVVSSDNTALTYRQWMSDGTTHYLHSGAWDATWPGGGGTDPSVWRFIFSHNCMRPLLGEHGAQPPDVWPHAGGRRGGQVRGDQLYPVQGEQGKQLDQHRLLDGDPHLLHGSWQSKTAASDTFTNAWLSGHAVGEGLDSSVIELGMLVELLSRGFWVGRRPDTGHRQANQLAYPVQDRQQRDGSNPHRAIRQGVRDAELLHAGSEGGDE